MTAEKGTRKRYLLETHTEDITISRKPGMLKLLVRTQPPSVMTQPLSVRTQPLEVRTQPLSVRTQPLSVRTQLLEVRTQPFSVRTQPLQGRSGWEVLNEKEPFPDVRFQWEPRTHLHPEM